MRTLLTFVLVAAAPVAWAQENTRAACTDKLDNDGDGHADCADQDCQDFAICASPSGPVDGSQRAKGVTRMVVGAGLLGFGLVFAAGSVPLYVFDNTHEPLTEIAIALDVLALGAFAAGVGLLAVGAGQLSQSKARRAVIPRFAVTRDGASLGFSATF